MFFSFSLCVCVFWLLIKIILICNAMRACEFSRLCFYSLNTFGKGIYQSEREWSKRQRHTIRRHINYWSYTQHTHTHTHNQFDFLDIRRLFSIRKFAASSFLWCPRHSFDLTKNKISTNKRQMKKEEIRKNFLDYAFFSNKTLSTSLAVCCFCCPVVVGIVAS